METKDTQIEGLSEQIVEQCQNGASISDIVSILSERIPAVKALQEELACATADCEREVAIGNEYLQKIAALQDENERLNTLVERVKLEATIHAQEARTANATVAEIYQAVTKATGEPGNWNGAKPVTDYIATLEAQLADERLFIKGLQAQLAGGEAVAWRPVFNIPGDFTTGNPSQETIDYWADQGVEIEYAYTKAPPIKQQVAEESFLRSVVSLCKHRGPSPRDIEAFDPEDKWIANLWRDAESMLATPTQPVSANQPDGGKVPPGYALVPIEPTTEMVQAGKVWVFTPDQAPTARSVWEAMIAASPSAPIAEGDEWISTKDRLPEIGERVLVVTQAPNSLGPRVKVMARLIPYEGATDYWWQEMHFGACRAKNALPKNEWAHYWMPLPAAPSDSVKEGKL